MTNLSKKAAAKKAVAKKVVLKKGLSKNIAIGKAHLHKAITREAAPRKTVSKGAVVKKAVVKKAVVKKAVPQKATLKKAPAPVAAPKKPSARKLPSRKLLGTDLPTEGGSLFDKKAISKQAINKHAISKHAVAVSPSPPPFKPVGKVAFLLPPGLRPALATRAKGAGTSVSPGHTQLNAKPRHASTKDTTIKTPKKSGSTGSISSEAPVVAPPSSGMPVGIQGIEVLEHHDPGFLEATEVFDEADQAQHQQLREMAAIQQHAQVLNRPEVHPDFDGTHCVSCGIDIPPVRLAMHKVRCVDCQGELEEANARSSKMRMPPPRSGGLGWDD